MASRFLLKLIFSVILICMLIVTTWASLHESVFVGGGKLLDQPWGVATLADTYFAFLTFFIWVAYRESRLATKCLWFVLIMALGNIAMSFYVLKELWSLPETAGLEGLFKKKQGV